MVYDTAHGESVMFGGYNGAYLADTWTLGPTGWIQRTTTPAPPARADGAMAYDPARQCAVLIGGTNGSTLTDVWEWSGTAWSLRATGVPGLDPGGNAAYDPMQGGVFYNYVTTNLLWNGSGMVSLSVPMPSSGGGASMVFHAASGGVLRKNGQYTRCFALPTGWQDLSSDDPFGVTSYAMACDPLRNRVFLQGGNGYVGNTSGSSLGRTWRWNGAVWSLVAGQDPLLAGHAMVFDFQRDALVMFGGRHNNGSLRDRTYRWVDSGTPASFVTYGQGCAGSLPVAPRLGADPLWNAAPVVGGQWFVRVDRCEPTRLVMGIVGLSDQSWGSVPLPLALAQYGMPTCELLVSAEATLTLGLSSTSGIASWITSIPSQPGLLGVNLFQQACVLSPSANATGLVWSNAGHGVLGT
jgi:hypothetical protein